MGNPVVGQGGSLTQHLTALFVKVTSHLHVGVEAVAGSLDLGAALFPGRLGRTRQLTGPVGLDAAGVPLVGDG